MENNDIKKALECCKVGDGCWTCPYDNVGVYSQCVPKLLEDALALITSQEQRIKELAEENKRLRADNEIKSQKRANIFEIANAFERGRTDGVREMHSEIKERCIKGGIYPAFVASTIDQIAKEMVEGEK